MDKRSGRWILIPGQLLFFACGAALTALWMFGYSFREGWWSNLPTVGLLLASLLVFSYEENTLGLAKNRRAEKDDPESWGGALEIVGFVTWLLLLVNMIATVFKGIRAIKHML